MAGTLLRTDRVASPLCRLMRLIERRRQMADRANPREP
jgi:hypothetical protein